MLPFRTTRALLLVGRVQARWDYRIHSQDQHLGRVGEGAGNSNGREKGFQLSFILTMVRRAQISGAT